jgi:hypothetical protein
MYKMLTRFFSQLMLLPEGTLQQATEKWVTKRLKHFCQYRLHAVITFSFISSPRKFEPSQFLAIWNRNKPFPALRNILT